MKDALRKEWQSLKGLQPDSWLLKALACVFVVLLARTVTKHAGALLDGLWGTPLGALEGQLNWVWWFFVKTAVLWLALSYFDRVRRGGRKDLEDQASAEKKEQARLEKALKEAEAAYRAAYAARRQPVSKTTTAVDQAVLEGDETNTLAVRNAAQTALSSFTPSDAQKQLDTAKKGDATLGLAISFVNRTWIIALMFWVGVLCGTEVYRLALKHAGFPPNGLLSKVVGVSALFAGAAFSDLVFFALFKGKMEWKGFWEALGAGVVITVATLIIAGWTQGFVEKYWPASGGDNWAFYLVPRDAKVLGDTPVEPTTADINSVRGWTLVPCSTRIKAGPNGATVYHATASVADNKSLDDLARLQSLADDRRSNPLNSGWTDQRAGKLIPWRFFITKSTRGGKTVVGLVRVTDRHQAFGPDGEKVFDISLYSKEQQAIVKKAFAIQAGG